MRGVETRIQEIRHRIFREVARMAYHTEWPVDKRIEELPYKIIPGEIGNYRSDVFLERAIVGERLRLAMGLPYRSAADPAPISDNIEAADQPETYYTPPLINVMTVPTDAPILTRTNASGAKGARMSVPTMQSLSRNVRVQRPAAWTAYTQMKTARRILIMINVYPAACAL